jgi:hypothetical protein
MRKKMGQMLCSRKHMAQLMMQESVDALRFSLLTAAAHWRVLRLRRRQCLCSVNAYRYHSIIVTPAAAFRPDRHPSLEQTSVSERFGRNATS